MFLLSAKHIIILILYIHIKLSVYLKGDLILATPSHPCKSLKK